MSVRLDFTQSIIPFLFHDRTPFSFPRDRTLSRAAFNVSARATAHGPHKGVYLKIFFFLIKNGH